MTVVCELFVLMNSVVQLVQVMKLPESALVIMGSEDFVVFGGCVGLQCQFEMGNVKYMSMW